MGPKPLRLELALSTPWRRRLAYGAFALLAFLFALRQTLPAEAVRERIVMEAAAAGWQVSIDDVGPAGLVGVSMRGVTLESRDGLKIPIERVDATVRLLPLLLGRTGISFDARLWDGRVLGFAERAGPRQRLVATIADLDLGKAAALRKASGLDLAGLVGGDLDLDLDEKETSRSAGQLALDVERAGVNGGAVPIPGMGSLTLPRVGLGKLTARASVKDGKLSFDRLESRGDDVELTGEGLYLVLQPRLAYANIFGKAKLRLHDSLWSRPGAANMRPIAEAALAQAKGPDGTYGLQVYGTLSQPMARLTR